VSQTKTHSLIESFVNVLLGWCINIAIQLCLFSAMEIPVTLGQNLTISATFTVVSITRSYCLRRIFNRVTAP
jgi:hypothetical protein